ncbi:MAG: hypothetical protein AMXMBFR59_27350 [Rhodanobacteraceae bacterium]
MGKVNGKSEADVEAFLAQLHDPVRGLATALRSAVRGADPAIAEGIKWKVPSFRTVDYFATMHLRVKQGIGLILHFGAKKTAISASGVEIPDPAGLLDWLARDRAMVQFRDETDLAARTPALQALLREWIRHL